MYNMRMQSVIPNIPLRLCVALCLFISFALAACTASPLHSESNRGTNLPPEDQALRQKYLGLRGVVLRLDAVSLKHGVMIISETGRIISSPSMLGPNNVGNQTYTDNFMPVPKAIHVTWREGDYKYQGQGVWKGGTIVGDYTVPVAERIPDEVLDYIRQHGGALRIKIRLKDDGVLIGWDVEERIPKPNWQPGAGAKNYLQYSTPGGDFREAHIVYGPTGKFLDPGWQK